MPKSFLVLNGTWQSITISRKVHCTQIHTIHILKTYFFGYILGQDSHQRTLHIDETIEKLSKFCFQWAGSVLLCVTVIRFHPSASLSFRTTWNTPSIEMNQSYRSQCCVVQMATETAGLNSLEVLSMGLYVYKRWGIYSFWVMIFAKMRQPITAAVALVTRGTLHKIWDEFYHFLNIGHVSQEHMLNFCEVCIKLWFFLY